MRSIKEIQEIKLKHIYMTDKKLEIRDLFLNNFSELIEQTKILI